MSDWNVSSTPVYPPSKIKQTSTSLVPADDHPTLVTIALCEDGTLWTITRIPSTGQFLGWEQYPAIPQGGAQ